MLANDLLEYILAFAECFIGQVVSALAQLVLLKVHIFGHL